MSNMCHWYSGTQDDGYSTILQLHQLELKISFNVAAEEGKD